MLNLQGSEMVWNRVRIEYKVKGFGFDMWTDVDHVDVLDTVRNLLKGNSCVIYYIGDRYVDMTDRVLKLIAKEK